MKLANQLGVFGTSAADTNLQHNSNKQECNKQLQSHHGIA
jgi:hypothetical protein